MENNIAIKINRFQVNKQNIEQAKNIDLRVFSII